MFIYEVPCKVIFGEGVSAQVGELSKSLNAKNVLVVYDKGVKSAGIVDPILQSLKDFNLNVNVFDNVMPNPTVEIVNEAVAFAKNLSIDLIVAIGGGSSMDSAKAINIMLTNEGTIEKYEGLDTLECETLPLIAIPTTSGTASEVTTFSIITDTKAHKKMIIGGKYVGATIALADPNLTLKLPPSITAATGMDAMTHAIEAYLSPVASPLTDVNAIKALDFIYNNLEECVKNGENSKVRGDVMLGSILAGFAFSSAYLGLAHGIAHPLGAHFNIAHGTANAIVLPYVVEFNGETVPEKVCDIGKAMGLDNKNISVDYVVTKIKELNKKIGIPTLSEIGITKSDFDLIAKATLQEASLHTNPRKTEYDDVINILEKAF